MKTLELYEKLSDEQKVLFDYIEDNGFQIHLYTCHGDEEICAEVEDWTGCGVDMIADLQPFCYDKLYDYYNYFDVDEEIEIHRQDKRYRDAFSIRQSLEDFEAWEERIKSLVYNFSY